MAQTAAGGAVFNGTPGTPRITPDPATDYLLPPAGALNYGSISSLTALMSTNGVATSLVHGDHFEMMNGNEIRTITLDRDHTILGNQYSTVKQDRHDTMESNYNQHVTGATQRTHIGATQEHFVAEHGNTHESDRHMNEPQKVWHVIDERIESANKITQTYGYKTEVVLAKTDICIGLSLGYTSIGVEHKVTKVEGTNSVGYEYGPIALESKALKQEVGGLKNEVDALKARLSNAELDVQELYATPFAIGVYL